MLYKQAARQSTAVEQQVCRPGRGIGEGRQEGVLSRLDKDRLRERREVWRVAHMHHAPLRCQRAMIQNALQARS